jgi:hypothetical protein
MNKVSGRSKTLKSPPCRLGLDKRRDRSCTLMDDTTPVSLPSCRDDLQNSLSLSFGTEKEWRDRSCPVDSYGISHEMIKSLTPVRFKKSLSSYERACLKVKSMARGLAKEVWMSVVYFRRWKRL